jgi:tRNA threonylcarbamoyladenosine biosynthesis protein TsaB
MIILAIDTAGVDCSAALYDAGAGRLIASRTEAIGKGHAELLPSMVDEVFKQADKSPKDIGLIGVTIGPGSFTGIRVGVAAARGFGLALSVPVIGVTTLEVLASMARATAPQKPILAAMDAKRGEIYTQLFDADGSAATEPQALSLEDAHLLATTSQAVVAGTGAGPLFSETTSLLDHFDIETVAKIAALRPNVTGKAAPLYLRGPDAKPQTGYAIERSA